MKTTMPLPKRFRLSVSTQIVGLAITITTAACAVGAALVILLTP